jgi:NTP pyrophosphatase (non-canonical NTP hydrolase)
VLALCGEAGELANYVKKEWRGDKLDLVAHRAKIESEVADVGNYIFMIAEVLGIDLLSAMRDKLYEVEKRPSWQSREGDPTTVLPKLVKDDRFPPWGR